MTTKRKHKIIYWFVFVIAISVFFYGLLHWSAFILTLPFVVTSFVKAMDII